MLSPADKALWYIESHFHQPLTLESISENVGVSPWHLTRAFGVATGRSIMRYVRERRLTQAARTLAQGAPDILAVALDAGYNSHEAFTRAFRDQFGRTPEALRTCGDLSTIQLIEPIRMDQSFLTDLAPPRFETTKAFLIAGFGQSYNDETSANIPAQWQRFGPHLQPGQTAYGVLCNPDGAGNIEYICGVEVPSLARIPEGWHHVQIPERRYAVFTHRDHISGIRRTWHTIFNQWLPESGYTVARAPEFEKYGLAFNPVTGLGGVEIWIPL